MTGARATRALVVDDERMNREVIVANLRAAGYETVTAEDGQQAWEILDRLPLDFDVILLDRRMPRMDGMELLSRLKGDDRLRHIPVIMQTAYASSDDVVDGIKAGVYYYLQKPLDRLLLLSVVASAVEAHSRFRRLSDDLEKRTSALSLLESGTFRFRTLEEGNRLAVALARVCPRSQFLAVGLSEMFTNAVEHGNLGITYEEKASLIAEKRLAKEVEAR
ncbi:MAG: response regulator, partial [Pseudomonadota bacterium]